jgi:hypothetical protein
VKHSVSWRCRCNAQAYEPPEPCSFLQPGQLWEGKQRVARVTNRNEDWRVAVEIQVWPTRRHARRQHKEFCLALPWS